MNLIQTFEPCKEPPGLKSNSILFLIIFLFGATPFAVLCLFTHMTFYILTFPLVISLIVLLTTKSAVRATISGIDHTITYRTLNWLGEEKDTIVNLSTAKVNYKYARLGKNTWGWRLRLYNNYFENRITLKEGIDFTKEQLDQMVAVFDQYKMPHS